MGILSSERLDKILLNSKLKNYTDFIETGTYTGRSIIPLSKKFHNFEFHTIEIVKELYLFAKEKAKKQSIQNINFHYGDSLMLLEGIISKIKSENIIVFLDAHSSSYEGYSAETIEADSSENFLMKFKNKILRKKKIISTDIKKNNLTKLDVPILEELMIISKINKNFLIIIDDFDLFEKKKAFADWSHVNKKKIEKIFLNKIINQFQISKQGLNSDQLIIEVKN